MAKPREDQEGLPGVADEKNPRVHAAAQRYAKRRDERMAANEEEKAAHDTLLEKMEEEGLESYCYRDVEVHIDRTKKAKVKIGGEPSKNGESKDEEE